MDDSRKIVEGVKAANKSVKTGVDAGARTGRNLTSQEDLHQAIAVIAYQLAESRNFELGHEMEDWLNAEGEVLEQRQGPNGFAP